MSWCLNMFGSCQVCFSISRVGMEPEARITLQVIGNAFQLTHSSSVVFYLYLG